MSEDDLDAAIDVLASTDPDLRVLDPAPSGPRGLVRRGGYVEELDEASGEITCG